MIYALLALLGVLLLTTLIFGIMKKDGILIGIVVFALICLGGFMFLVSGLGSMWQPVAI